MDPQPPASTPSNSPKKLGKFLLFLFLIFCFIGAFAGGYFLRDVLKAENPSVTTTKSKPNKTPLPTKTNNPSVSPIPGTESDTTLFLPGKTYFDDTIIAVTKDAPHQAIALSARRVEQDSGFIQSTGFSYFDGNTWSRKQDSNQTSNSQIVTNSLIKNWTDSVDPSRVLKESVHTLATINNNTIEVFANDLTNEIGMRSLPGYTKFMSNVNGTITINGKTYQAHILYTRIYSLNAKDIQFYDTPLGLKTYWIAFWDDNGGFYHIDTTAVSKPTDVYKTHQIAIEETPQGGIFKSFSVPITSDNLNPPTSFTVTTNTPDGAILNIKRLNALNKAPNNSYTWIMGTVTGSVTRRQISSDTESQQTINGIGLVEYIQD